MFKRTRRVESGPTGSESAVATEAVPTQSNTQGPEASSARLPNGQAPAAAMPPAQGEPSVQRMVDVAGVAVKSKVQAVIVEPDVDLGQFRQLPDTDRGDPEFFSKHWKGEKTVVYALFMRQRFPFWKAIVHGG